jgi:hypothetical protein
MTCLEVL